MKAEWIEIVHRDVYSLSERLLDQHGRWLAAVLALPDAALSYRSAAALWRIGREVDGQVEVTTTRKPKRRRDIRVHYAPLAPDEVTVREGIPVTTPARTLFDIAYGLRRHELEKAVREADNLRLAGGPSLPELAERYPRRMGVRAVRQLLDAGWSEAPTRSTFESRFTAFIDEYNLSRPERNALIDLGTRPVEVDFVWRRSNLIVELDGYATHGARGAFEDDRARDRMLQRG